MPGMRRRSGVGTSAARIGEGPDGGKGREVSYFEQVLERGKLRVCVTSMRKVLFNADVGLVGQGDNCLLPLKTAEGIRLWQAAGSRGRHCACRSMRHKNQILNKLRISLRSSRSRWGENPSLCLLKGRPASSGTSEGSDGRKGIGAIWLKTTRGLRGGYTTEKGKQKSGDLPLCGRVASKYKAEGGKGFIPDEEEGSSGREKIGGVAQSWHRNPHWKRHARENTAGNCNS